MPGRSPLVLGVTELRRRPGTQREVEVVASLDDLAITGSRVPEGDEVTLHGLAEAIEGAVTVTGSVTGRWVGACRRCLEEVEGAIVAEVREVFEPNPTDGETYPIEGDEVDLEPVLRDAILLSLPLAPLCRPDCRGPAPEEFPAVVAGDEPAGTDTDGDPPRDPRWAALDELRFD